MTLQTRLARLEAIIDSSLIVDGTTSNGTCMSYEEEDTCLSLIVDGTTSNGTDAPKEKRIIRNDMNK
jgi:hypothetical protein